MPAFTIPGMSDVGGYHLVLVGFQYLGHVALADRWLPYHRWRQLQKLHQGGRYGRWRRVKISCRAAAGASVCQNVAFHSSPFPPSSKSSNLIFASRLSPHFSLPDSSRAFARIKAGPSYVIGFSSFTAPASSIRSRILPQV